MIKYITGIEDSYYARKLGKRYIISKRNLQSVYVFNTYENNTFIPLKFTLLGCKTNCSIEIELGKEEKIILNNTIPIETIFKYRNQIDFLKINIPNDIINEVAIELIVGLIEDDLKSYKQIDFIDSLGSLDIGGKKGVIIKIPKDFNEDFYDYSIIIPYDNDNNYGLSEIGVQISYDKIEFLAHPNKIEPNFKTIIPLFNTNPYLFIQNNKDSDNNKFFYISIYNFRYSSRKIYIQKPKLFSNVKINAINKLPQLKDNKYYYQIPFPKGEYNYLLVQYSCKNKEDILLKVSKNDFIYDLEDNEDNKLSLETISAKKKNFNNDDNVYLNLYLSNSSEIYINLNPINESFDKEMNYDYLFFYVKQISDKNKLQIHLSSESKRPNRYYLLFNIPYNKDLFFISSIISGQKNLDKKKYQAMMSIDFDEKDIIRDFEVKSPIKFDKQNNVVIVSTRKDSFIFYNIYFTSFSYDYVKISDRIINILLISLIPIEIICLCICYFKCRKKKKKKDNLSSKMIEKELNLIIEPN